jgi:hypothetical protein
LGHPLLSCPATIAHWLDRWMDVVSVSVYLPLPLPSFWTMSPRHLTAVTKSSLVQLHVRHFSLPGHTHASHIIMIKSVFFFKQGKRLPFSYKADIQRWLLY